MSAFLCTNDHINALVDYAVRNRACSGDPTVAGRKLVVQNLISLRVRYGDDVDPAIIASYTYRPQPLLSPVQVLKLCDCYDYQTCESEDYKAGNWSYDFIDGVRDTAIRNLPGYEEAEWVI